MNRRMFAIQGGLAGAALLLSPAATAADEREDKEKMKHTIDNLMMSEGESILCGQTGLEGHHGLAQGRPELVGRACPP
jgi:hypothetical protein